MVQQVKPAPAVRLLQLPAQVPGKAALDGSSACAPDSHVGDLGEVPGSWFQPGSALTVAAIWEVNQWTKDFLSFQISK